VADDNSLACNSITQAKFLAKYIQIMITIFSALADPIRLHIVELLLDGPLTVGEIADRGGLRQPQATKHLQVLSNAGIIEVQPLANRRIYRLRPQSLKELDVWLESFRRIWDSRYDSLDDYLNELKE
jgi:DNA-binding transcriptional ArsR family regulator